MVAIIRTEIQAFQPMITLLGSLDFIQPEIKAILNLHVLECMLMEALGGLKVTFNQLITRIGAWISYL